MPRHVWESVADPLTYEGDNRSLGSGPFTLGEYDQTEGAYRLLAHDGYWRGRPLAREWRQITVPAEALTGRLTSGALAVLVAVTILSVVASRAFWRYGVRNYSGASA